MQFVIQIAKFPKQTWDHSWKRNEISAIEFRNTSADVDVGKLLKKDLNAKADIESEIYFQSLIVDLSNISFTHSC